MAAFFGFGGIPVDIEINLHGEEGRKQIEQKGEKDKKELCAVYLDGESVSGQVSRARPLSINSISRMTDMIWVESVHSIPGHGQGERW